MSTATSEQKTVRVKEVSQSTNLWLIVLERLRRNKVAMLAFYYIMLNVLIAIFYPILIPFDPIERAPGKDSKFGGGVNAFPTLKYPAGINQPGQDIFSRLLAGSEISILVGIFATLISVIIGVLVGLLAGYYQGKVEEILMRVVDLFLAVPFLLIAIVLVQLITSGQAKVLQGMPVVWVITFVIGFFGWAGLARLVTANVKQVAALEYVSAVKIMGARDSRILFVHILPNVSAPIIVITALFTASAILSEAGLAFLGIGDPANTVSWGIMVNNGRTQLAKHPEQSLFPGFAIFFLVLCINLFGDALRDALDPKLKN